MRAEVQKICVCHLQVYKLSRHQLFSQKPVNQTHSFGNPVSSVKVSTQCLNVLTIQRVRKDSSDYSSWGGASAAVEVDRRENATARRRVSHTAANHVEKNTHITAVCSNPTKVSKTENHLCLRNDAQVDVLLPSLSVLMYSANGNCEIVRCLIDHGSQTSYISKYMADKLAAPRERQRVKYQVRTFIGTAEKQHDVVVCDVHFTRGRTTAKLLVDDNLSLGYHVPGVTKLVQKCKSEDLKLADSFFRDMSDDRMTDFHCLLGSDLIGYIQPLNSVKVGRTTVYEIDDGMILFGDISSLMGEQNSVAPAEHRAEHLVNLAINPTCAYFSPVSLTSGEVDVDVELENMFKVENIGIKDDTLAETDEALIKQFYDSIEFKDGHYLF